MRHQLQQKLLILFFIINNLKKFNDKSFHISVVNWATDLDLKQYKTLN